MTRARASIAGALLLVLVPALTGACVPRPSMTRSDARLFTAKALVGVGLRDVHVGPTVHAELCGDPALAGWRTTASVSGGGTVELCVQRNGDRALSVRDVGPDLTGSVLTDAQFRALGHFRFDPTAARRHRQTVGAGVAAACLLVGALILLSTRVRKDRSADAI